MQQELMRVIQERTGLDEAKAQQVTDVVFEFLRTKLPPQVASMLDGESSNVGGGGGMLGGMFGGRSE